CITIKAEFFMRLYPNLAVSVLILLVSVFSSKGQTASFTASPTSGCPPLVVNFTNTTPAGWTSTVFDFGNGAPTYTMTPTGANPSSTYTSPGTYTVTVVA